jgi:hypothetical protein
MRKFNVNFSVEGVEETLNLDFVSNSIDKRLLKRSAKSYINDYVQNELGKTESVFYYINRIAPID